MDMPWDLHPQLQGSFLASSWHCPSSKAVPLLCAVSYFSLCNLIRHSIINSVLLPLEMQSKLKLHLFLKMVLQVEKGLLLATALPESSVHLT